MWLHGTGFRNRERTSHNCVEYEQVSIYNENYKISNYSRGGECVSDIGVAGYYLQGGDVIVCSHCAEFYSPEQIGIPIFSGEKGTDFMFCADCYAPLIDDIMDEPPVSLKVEWSRMEY